MTDDVWPESALLTLQKCKVKNLDHFCHIEKLAPQLVKDSTDIQAPQT